MCSQHLFSTAGDVTDNRTSLLPANTEQLTFITIYPNRFQGSFFQMFRGRDRETLERNDTSIYLGNLFIVFFFFVSMGTKCLHPTRFFFFLIAHISCPAGDYSILRESRKFQPVCLHSACRYLCHWFIAAKLGCWQHHTLGTYLPLSWWFCPLEHCLKVQLLLFKMFVLSNTATCKHVVEGRGEKETTTNKHKTVKVKILFKAYLGAFGKATEYITWIQQC